MLARLFVVVVILASTALTAQEEAARLSYAVPDGWTRHADGRTLLPPGGDAAVTFRPSIRFSGTGEQWLTESWNGLRRELKLIAGAEPGHQGPFLTRMGQFQQADGANIWVVLNTLVKDGRGEAVIFLAANQETFRAHLPTLSAMLRGTPLRTASSPALEVTKKSAPPTAPNGLPPASDQGSNRVMNPRPTLDDYDFIPPAGWLVQKHPDHIVLTQTPDRTGCRIQILPPQPSSGDLEKDAGAVFDMMYAGWQPGPTATERIVVSKGFLPKGLEFCRLEAGMAQTSPDGRYHTEDGEALAIRMGDQIAVIAVRHRGLLAHPDCLDKYETWRRFFNSFTVRNAPTPENREPAPAERIIGRWSMRESGAASSEYIFAANGNYAHSGALGSSFTTSDYNHEYLHITTYAFTGDGTYSLSGDELTLSKRGVGNFERMRIRFEKVNRGGGGWNDRMLVLTNLRSGENEVRYERTPPPTTAPSPAVAPPSAL